MEFGIVLLAAGASRRMGSEHKLLLAWGDRTVAGQALVAAASAPVRSIVVVLGNRAKEVKAGLVQALRSGNQQAYSVEFVENELWEQGMFTSVMLGIENLLSGVDAFFVALGDMPMIPTKVYSLLMDRYDEKPGFIYVPTWEGRRGHPVLLPIDLPAAKVKADSDSGLRGLLRQYPERVVEVPVGYPGVCVDLDTPEEYARYVPKPNEQ
jgi:CTP:molybdopterin cytidylyltransferase MocA